MKNEGSEALDDLQQQLHAELKKYDIAPDRAMKISHEMREHFRKLWGGGSVYFGKTADISERDMAIYCKFDGKNYRALAREYEVSVKWIYEIVRRVHKKEIAERQMDIFGESP